jgi:hypothetical protein
VAKARGRFLIAAGLAGSDRFASRLLKEGNHPIPQGPEALVRAASGIKWVRLRYRSVNQQDDYRTLPMLPTGEKECYRAVIPPEHIVLAWDLMYLIEVMDHRGNGRIYPDLNNETSYLVVRIAR